MVLVREGQKFLMHLGIWNEEPTSINVQRIDSRSEGNIARFNQF